MGDYDDDDDDDGVHLVGEGSDGDPLTGPGDQRCWTGGEVARYQSSTDYHHYYVCFDDHEGGVDADLVMWRRRSPCRDILSPAIAANTDQDHL